MTRKHYIASAKIIKNITDKSVRKQVALEFADMFRADNVRFDRDRFFTACDL